MTTDEQKMGRDLELIALVEAIGDRKAKAAAKRQRAAMIATRDVRKPRAPRAKVKTFYLIGRRGRGMVACRIGA